jgi:hypothetical protein
MDAPCYGDDCRVPKGKGGVTVDGINSGKGRGKEARRRGEKAKGPVVRGEKPGFLVVM